MDEKVLVPVEIPKEFKDLESVYDTYYYTYLSIFDKDGKFYDLERATQSNQRLYEICLKMIDVINQNRDKFEPIKKVKTFSQIEKLLTDWKRNLVDNNSILHFRKCINWLRKIDPNDDSYFL